MAVDKRAFRAVMGSFAASVTIVTTLDPDGSPHGLTATAFSSLSMDPPLCLVCVDKAARAHKPMTIGRRFAVNILAVDQEYWSSHFASQLDDKFNGIQWQAGAETGCPLLPGVLASVECEVVDIFRGGDHDIFVGHVLGADAVEGEPLVYWRGRYAKIGPITGKS